MKISTGVKNIEEWAFQGCNGLTELEISNTVENIDYAAFYGCTSLSNLTIPNSITSIQENTFYGCTGLTSIEIPNSVTSISNGAFRGCENLSTIIIDSNEIVSKNYDYDGNLGSIFGNQVKKYIIGENVTSIGGNVFYDCTGLTSIEIPNSVTTIGNNAFEECTSLTSIEMPKSMTIIGDDAFAGCSALEKVIVQDIAAWCGVTFGNLFSNPLYYAHRLHSMDGTEIASLDIPSSVKKINNYAFYGWSSLKSLVIPNGLQSIGMNAFSNCSSLEKIVIPNTVTSIGKEAFSDCMSLYSVTSLINLPFKLDETAFQYTGNDYSNDIIYMAATLYVPRGRTAMYSNVEGWKKFTNIMETDTKFRLTYMLDGEKYKEYEIQATEVITPEPDPVKEGYIFSGWSEIPYLMPAQDVTITGSFAIDQTSVDCIAKGEDTPKAYYSIGGRRLDAPQKGLNIIRTSDGTVRKVMVK